VFSLGAEAEDEHGDKERCRESGQVCKDERATD
jgi:hypothetical protein